MPVVKAALLTILQAAITDLAGGGKVTFGWPGGKMRRENVWLGDARFEREEVAGMRPKPHPHNERYTLPVHVWLVAAGDDAQAAEARWYAIAAEVEDALRTNPDLGVAGVHWALVTGKEPHAFVDDGVRGHEGAVLIDIHARI